MLSFATANYKTVIGIRVLYVYTYVRIRPLTSPIRDSPLWTSTFVVFNYSYVDGNWKITFVLFKFVVNIRGKIDKQIYFKRDIYLDILF